MKQNLGRMLLEANLIDEVQMKVALAEQKRTGKRFGSTLVDLKFVDENVLAAFLSKQIDIPCISLLNVEISRKVVRKLSGDVARRCLAVPVKIEGDRLEVAMSDPVDIDLLRDLEESAGMTVIPLVAPQSSIEKMIDRLYPEEEGLDTVAAFAKPGMHAIDPQFEDLIEEIESGDIEGRLERIETKIDEVWMLLEKVLRRLEKIGGKSDE